MKKRSKNRFAFFLALLLLVSSFAVTPKADAAGFADNYSLLYYDLARLVYDVENNSYSHRMELSEKINDIHGDKFHVISAVNIDSNIVRHPMSTSADGSYQHIMDNTGFKAMAVVAAGSEKVFIAFSGTDSAFGIPNTGDVATAVNTLQGDSPGQLYQAQLFTNYIHENFKYAQDWDWYFTGHSLGGWLSSKVYLDMRSANWLIPSRQKYFYGGGIKKDKISGVYNFNPLPIRKNQLSSTQWNANKNKVYHQEVKNLVINNEWLNGVRDMNPTELAYIGQAGEIKTENITPYWATSYKPENKPLYDISRYAAYSKLFAPDIMKAHGIGNFKAGGYVGY